MNTSVTGGSYGKPTHTGEVVIGGGMSGAETPTGVAGYNQMSTVILTGVTVTNSVVTLNIQGIEGEYINTQANTVMMFEVFLTGVCTGGADGTAGHYTGYNWFGTCKTANDLANTVATPVERKEIVGTTGTPVLDFATDGFMYVKVTGVSNVIVQWNATVKMYINKVAVEL